MPRPIGAPPQPAPFTVALPLEIPPAIPTFPGRSANTLLLNSSMRIVLENNGQVLSTVPLSSNAPQVRFLQTFNFLSPWGRPSIRWRAWDADGDPVRYALFYSPDGGKPENQRRMIPLGVDLSETSFRLDPKTLPGSNFASFRIFATDNRGQTSVADSAPFFVVGTPPRVTIAAPRDGSQFRAGTAILFRADVDDPLRLDLLPAAYSWYSDRDRTLPRGPTIGSNTLSIGRHTITSTVTNSRGLRGSASVEIFITP